MLVVGVLCVGLYGNQMEKEDEKDNNSVVDDGIDAYITGTRETGASNQTVVIDDSFIDREFSNESVAGTEA